MRFAWPLTGRSEEMRIIEAALSASDLSGIVVCGAAGVGKSRISREAPRLPRRGDARPVGRSAPPRRARFRSVPSPRGRDQMLPTPCSLSPA